MVASEALGMDTEGQPALCPSCDHRYVFFADPAASDLVGERPSERDGRLLRRCYRCSFENDRWDVLWIPLFAVMIASFPLLWMIWSNLIGPFVFLTGAALPVWRRMQQRRQREATRCASSYAP